MSDADTDNTAAVDAAREKFLASLADPPDNVSVVVERAAKEAAASEAEGPKAAGNEKPSTAKPAESARNRATASVSSEPYAPSSAASGADAVLDALRKGDLDTIAELTGADPADFDERSTKFAARTRRDHATQRELDRVREQTRAVLEEYEPVDSAREAYAAAPADPAPLRAILEHVTGKPWSQLAAQLGVAAPAAAAPSPAADRVLVESLRDDVPDDHEVRKVPDWETRAVALMRASVDEHTGDPTISFRQAAARVLRQAREEYRKLSAVFGAADAAPRDATPRTPERAAGAVPAQRRKLTREEFLARFSGPGKD